MASLLIDPAAVRERRDLFFRRTREELPKWNDPATGAGRVSWFQAPFRDAIWLLPALLHGSEEDVAWADRIVARYEKDGGNKFNIFQSTIFSGLLAEYGPLFSEDARKVMIHHAQMAFRTFGGAGQPDLKYHGCNDNMPTMATKALILGGEYLHDEHAYRQGVWNLNELRRLFSRAAWTSEFNSSSYSPITLCNLAKIANLAKDPQVRETARLCEERVWAELILHWHPGTKRCGGPQSRAYQMNYVGHTHTLPSLFWLLFGEELSGYNPVKTLFEDRENQVINYGGVPIHTAASFCEYIDTEFHLPDHLAELFVKRTYPALTRGRAEAMSCYTGSSAEYHTTSYMEENFSLGSSNIPMVDGHQTVQFYATGKLRKEIRSFRDSFCVFNRYSFSRVPPEGLYDSRDGFTGEAFLKNYSGAFAMQKNNTVILLSVPLPELAGKPVSLLKMDLVFPLHFIHTPFRSTLNGMSSSVVPVSIDAGETYLHIQPLLPGTLPREYAVAWTFCRDYAVLELVNYEGPERTFTAEELAMIQNGFAFTIDSKGRYASLEEFHRKMRWERILDYTLSRHRFLRLQRKDVQFEVCYTPVPFGVQTHAVDGRTEEEKVFESNQIPADDLPFLSGEVRPEEPFFPWGDSLEMNQYPEFLWQIGSRGIPGEEPYSGCRTK